MSRFAGGRKRPGQPYRADVEQSTPPDDAARQWLDQARRDARRHRRLDASRSLNRRRRNER